MKKRLAPAHNPCLVEALTAYYFFVKNGYPVKLVNGINKAKKETLEAHAWIEYKNKVLIGKHPEIGKFKPIYTFLQNENVIQ